MKFAVMKFDRSVSNLFYFGVYSLEFLFRNYVLAFVRI